MERLTKKMQGKDGKEKYVIKAEFLNNPSEFTRKLIDKLGEYEDLNESGIVMCDRAFSEVEFLRVLESVEKEVIGELLFLTTEEAVRKMKDRTLKAFLGEEV